MSVYLYLWTIQNKYKEMNFWQTDSSQRLVHTIYHFTQNHVGQDNWASSLTCYSKGYIKNTALLLWKCRDECAPGKCQ